MIRARVYRGGGAIEEVEEAEISRHVGDKHCLLWVDVAGEFARHGKRAHGE